MQLRRVLREGVGEVGHVWSLTRQLVKYGERGKFAASVRHRNAERFSISCES